MGVLGGVFVLESGLGILIRALEVPFLGPPKRQKWVILGVLGVPKMALRVPESKLLLHASLYILTDCTRTFVATAQKLQQLIVSQFV